VADQKDVSRLLAKLASGDRTVENELFPLIYDELRRLAKIRLQGERPGHSMQATALVHEVYLRMAARASDVKGRIHFFALASKVMRQVLIDSARARNSIRRGGLKRKISLDDAVAFYEDHPDLVILLERALTKLALLDSQQAQIVELRFYAGLTEEEIALILSVSTRTVKRDWRSARAWLEAELTSTQGERQDQIGA